MAEGDIVGFRAGVASRPMDQGINRPSGARASVQDVPPLLEITCRAILRRRLFDEPIVDLSVRYIPRTDRHSRLGKEG